jgi:hypothetical protein
MVINMSFQSPQRLQFAISSIAAAGVRIPELGMSNRPDVPSEQVSLQLDFRDPAVMSAIRDALAAEAPHRPTTHSAARRVRRLASMEP